MRAGIPTIAFILVCASGLAWWAFQPPPKPTAPDAGAVTSRPVPSEGWGPLGVMTANIRFDDPADGDNSWVHRRELLVRTFLKYQPDIIACQEVTPAQGAYLHRQLGAWYDYYPRGGVGAAGSATNGATRSAASEILGALTESMASLTTLYFRSDRLAIVDGEAGLVIPGEPQPTPAENTLFSLAVLKENRQGGAKVEGSGTLIVVDVHFRMNDAFAAKCAARLEEKIVTWEKKYPNSGILVLGDMNRDRLTPLYAQLTHARAENAAGGPWDGLQDLFDYSKTPAGGVGGGVNNGGNFHHYTGKTNRAWPTDLIFLGGGLKVAMPAEVVRDQGADGRYPSDHFFVRGQVSW